MRVLFGIRNDGADAFYRAVAPASFLRFQGIEAEARGVSLADAADFDILILQRQCSPAAEVIMREFQDRGKPVVYDVDDWLGGIPPFWPAYDDYFVRGQAEPTELLVMHERLLRQADCVTCTGPTLAERMLHFNENVRIVRNCVMMSRWDTLAPLEMQLPGKVVGWFGMPYYWDTWRDLAPALEAVVCEEDAYLSILGFPEVVQMFSQHLAARTFVQPLVRWRDFASMQQLIMSFDVGLAWLHDSPFNRCKSPLKALQLGAAGVPVVASPMPYSEVLSQEYPGQYGQIAETPDVVYECLLEVLNHPEPARLMAAAWQETVWTQHSYETQWRQWESLIVDLCPQEETEHAPG